MSTAYTNAKSQVEYIESLEKEHGIRIEDFDIEGVGTNMVVQKYRATVQPPATDEFVYINATIVPFMSTNKLNAQSRTLPIEFPLPITYGIRCALELPEGYAVEELPKNINISAYEDGAKARREWLAAHAGDLKSMRRTALALTAFAMEAEAVESFEELLGRPIDRTPTELAVAMGWRAA